MTTDQLAAILHMRDVGVKLNAVTPQGQPVVPYSILADLDDLIAEARMTARVLPRDAVDRLNGEIDLHSVHVDRIPDTLAHRHHDEADAYDLLDPKHPTFHDRMSDLADL